MWMASYSNAGEVLFACLAVYNLRGLERIFGSRKYAVQSFVRVAIYVAVVSNLLIPHKLDPGATITRSTASASLIKPT